ncbi:hypothetical protein HNW77_11860 [Komagataeibacter sp. AV436]|uniref:Uncharacterized protein n=1 Tax=Komagataeibacter melomenusus TaxID=2766578 RepID=A0ABX2AGS5_9PROT|nr:hypothetical protein [Komagataeibacter melomenusus]MBV1831332.1 hypothetical protein [Komagataeibacter melomenusus]NPC67072.1 hypothetical protein [Komagataeibacter melomenusus]
MAGTVSITLGRAEALILFEILSREPDRPECGKFQVPGNRDADYWAFDELLGTLERVLPEPFGPGYDQYLSDAAHNLIRRRGRLPGPDHT